MIGCVIFSLLLRSHSISFAEAQGIPKYKIGLERGEDGRVGVGLVGVTGDAEDSSLAVMLITGQFKNEGGGGDERYHDQQRLHQCRPGCA